MYIEATVNEATRVIKWDKSQIPAVNGDIGVNGFIFKPLGLDPNFNLLTGVWRVSFENDNSTQPETVVLTETDSNGYPKWTLNSTINEGGALVWGFAVSVTKTNQNAEVTQRFYSTPSVLRVPETVNQSADSAAQEEALIDALTALILDLHADAEMIGDVQDVLSRITNSTPVKAETAAEMTGAYIYYYVGSEAGYNKGHLYYYDGTAPVDVCLYGAYQLDTELKEDGSPSGKAADSGVTGAAIKQVNEELGALSDELGEYEGIFTEDVDRSVQNWLDAHPEATTAVQDHSLTYAKLVNGTLGFVTPEMYGAVGDGVTDDSNAFNSAFASGCNVICKSDKTYYLENTIRISHKCVFDGNNAVFKLKPYSARHQVFIVEADGVVIRNLIGVSEFTGTYDGNTPSDCNQFIFIASSDVLVENIRTNTVFSAVYLNDGNPTIKKNIVINNIIAINGQFTIFARYVDGLTITNCYLTANSNYSDFHQIYIASNVANVDIDNVTVLGSGTSLVSLHPSSNYPETPDITNVTINNIVIRGEFVIGIEFRSCSNVTVSNARIVSESTAANQFLIRHEASEKIVIKDSILYAVNGFIFSPDPSDGSYETEHTSEITICNCYIDFVENARVQMIYRVCTCKIINSTIRVTGSISNPYVFYPGSYDVLAVLSCTIYSVNKAIHVFGSLTAASFKLIDCKAYTAVTRLNFGVYTGGNVYVYGCKGYGFTHCVSGADNFDAITGALDNNIYSNVVQVE